MVDYVKYLGIPWKDGGRNENEGLDCWGFVRYYYEKEKNVILPKYEGVSSTEIPKSDCSDFIVNSFTYKLFDQVNDPIADDICLFTVGGDVLHVGIVIDSKKMIHASRITGTVIEDYTSQKWSKRLSSFHRLKQTE